ncbi:MAG TPA: TetR/AcrR family transcriptional regulator [Solirubrobacterales bacterium]|nr:TetR/AcrR family transcriptional regulator [Solirubrobacterales bacterium]
MSDIASQTASKPPRVTKRRAETRQRLLEAARFVFAEKGFGRTSVEDVCERAGYTRGAFYSNFSSLDELFLAMWEQRLATLLGSFAQSLEAASREEVISLEDGIDRLLDLLPVDDLWYRVQAEFTAHALRNPVLRGVVAARESQIAATLLPFIDGALERVGREVADREALAAALIAVHDGTALQCLIEPDEPRVRRQRRDLFLAVVRAYTEERPGATSPRT